MNMDTLLKNVIHQSLQLQLHANATFLCERLYAEYQTLENLHMLANCYLQSGQYKTVYHFLRENFTRWRVPADRLCDPQHSTHYLYAICCIKLRYFEEAENILLQYHANKTEEPAVNYWLGIICRYTNRREASIEYLNKSIGINPFLWCAFENLAQMGADVDIQNIFDSRKADLISQQILQQQRANNQSLFTQPNDQFQPQILQFTSTPMKTTNHSNLTPNLSFSTPGSTGKQGSRGLDAINHKESVNDMKDTSSSIERTVPLSNSFKTPSPQMTVPPNSVVPAREKIQRKKPPMYNGGKKLTSKLFDDPIPSPFAKSGPSPPDHIGPLLHSFPSTPSNIATQHSSLDNVRLCLSLLRDLARPYLLFCHYRCAEAIECFVKLPQRHFHSGWVLCHVGKSYFEMAQYENAERAFERLTLLEPYRLEGLEVYSTILWHLKKETRLSHLAHHMSEVDKLSPYSLCAIGNCFSLQKDHETALKFFERATRLNDLFTYAYTLAGHEHFANDDLDEALECYRHAIRIDARHYNAWYGLGTVYFRQEKFELAEYHFRRALAINDKSSVLYCYCGMALTATGRHSDAIHMLDRALELHPQNPMAKFKRANALLSLNRYTEALQELEELHQIVPKESSVHFSMGKICARLNMKDKALYHYNMALDLESPSRDSPFIKEAISKLFSEEDEESQNDEL